MIRSWPWWRALAVAMVLAIPRPAPAGPPFETDDPEPVELGHWEIYGYTLGTFAHGEKAGLLPATEVNYGALPNVQLHLTAGLGYNSQSPTGTRFGYGDTQIGVKYRFITPGEDDWWPQVGTFPMLAFPSGNAASGLGTGRLHEFLPIWVQKDFGRWSTYGGGGYWNNPGPGNKSYWFTGWLLQRRMTDDLLLGAEVFHQTASISGGPGTAGFPLGSRDTTGFNLGGVYDFSEHTHLLFSAGRGLQNASTTNEFSYYAALQWTF
jgi:hypothetical protein